MDLVNELSSKYGLSLDEIRAILSIVAKFYFAEGEITPLTYRQMFYRTEFVKSHARTAIVRETKANLDSSRNVVSELADSLVGYPLWYSYVVSQRDETFYNNDGSFHQDIGREQTRYDAAPTKSYAAWVTEVITKSKDLVLYGIHEVFPQEKTAEISPVAQASGHKREWKKWKILQATELVSH